MEAQAAFEEDEIPIGAVIVCRDRIISRAHNLTEMLTDVTAHAEMQAITSGANMLGGKYLKDCTLYVTVEPCVMCAGALGWSQISAWCMVQEMKRGYTKYAPHALHPKTLVTSGVLEDECRALMQQFFARKDKTVSNYTQKDDAPFQCIIFFIFSALMHCFSASTFVSNPIPVTSREQPDTCWCSRRSESW